MSSSDTGVRIIFRIPPVVFLPNRVPCGPRSTSIRSISKFSRSTPLEVPRNIPSMTTPIEGSKLLSLSSDATPRIVIAAPLAIPGVRLINRLGANACTSSIRRTVSSWSWSVIAETASGTSWMDSSFLRAVTVISSIARLSAASARLGVMLSDRATATTPR